jgi:hypothetical protein
MAAVPWKRLDTLVGLLLEESHVDSPSPTAPPLPPPPPPATTTTAPSVSVTSAATPVAAQFFAGLRVHVIEAMLGPKRAELFRRQVVDHGGVVVRDWRDGAAYIVTDLPPTALASALGTAELPVQAPPPCLPRPRPPAY